MRRISTKVANFLAIKSERGVTAIEYGLIASLVALAIIVGATLLGHDKAPSLVGVGETGDSVTMQRPARAAAPIAGASRDCTCPGGV